MSKHITSFNEAWILDRKNWHEILHCVEIHDELVNALRKLVMQVETAGNIQLASYHPAKQALAKVEENDG